MLERIWEKRTLIHYWCYYKLLLLLLSRSVVSDSVWPQRREPTRLPHPWDSPGKNTGVGCHFLLQYMKVKSESEVAQSCPTLSDPMDCSPPGSSVHGTFHAKAVEWGATGSSGDLITSMYRDRLEKHWINFPGPIFFKAISLKVTVDICRKIYTF